MKNVEVLLKAINLANYDNVKNIQIPLQDLMMLRAEIITLRKSVDHYKKQADKFEKALTKSIIEPKVTHIDSYC